MASEELKCVPCGMDLACHYSYVEHMSSLKHQLKMSTSDKYDGRMLCVLCNKKLEGLKEYCLHIDSKDHTVRYERNHRLLEGRPAEIKEPAVDTGSARERDQRSGSGNSRGRDDETRSRERSAGRSDERDRERWKGSPREKSERRHAESYRRGKEEQRRNRKLSNRPRETEVLDPSTFLDSQAPAQSDAFHRGLMGWLNNRMEMGCTAWERPPPLMSVNVRGPADMYFPRYPRGPNSMVARDPSTAERSLPIINFERELPPPFMYPRAPPPLMGCGPQDVGGFQPPLIPGHCPPRVPPHFLPKMDAHHLMEQYADYNEEMNFQIGEAQDMARQSTSRHGGNGKLNGKSGSGMVRDSRKIPGSPSPSTRSNNSTHSAPDGTNTVSPKFKRGAAVRQTLPARVTRPGSEKKKCGAANKGAKAKNGSKQKNKLPKNVLPQKEKPKRGFFARLSMRRTERDENVAEKLAGSNISTEKKRPSGGTEKESSESEKLEENLKNKGVLSVSASGTSAFTSSPSRIAKRRLPTVGPGPVLPVAASAEKKKKKWETLACRPMNRLIRVNKMFKDRNKKFCLTDDNGQPIADIAYQSDVSAKESDSLLHSHVWGTGSEVMRPERLLLPSKPSTSEPQSSSKSSLNTNTTTASSAASKSVSPVGEGLAPPHPESDDSLVYENIPMRSTTDARAGMYGNGYETVNRTASDTIFADVERALSGTMRTEVTETGIRAQASIPSVGRPVSSSCHERPMNNMVSTPSAPPANRVPNPAFTPYPLRNQQQMPVPSETEKVTQAQELPSSLFSEPERTERVVKDEVVDLTEDTVTQEYTEKQIFALTQRESTLREEIKKRHSELEFLAANYLAIRDRMQLLDEENNQFSKELAGICDQRMDLVRRVGGTVKNQAKVNELPNPVAGKTSEESKTSAGVTR